jgi:transposase
MNDLIRIGIDTSKSVFVLHGVDSGERPVLRRKFRRRQVLDFFKKLPPTLVGMEACAGAHYWGREIGALGHQVSLLPAHRVKPYVPRNKNDSADAEGVCEAMSRPRMRSVPVKTAEQQAALMLVGVREHLVAGRTQLSNMIRGHATEFGLVAAKGLEKIDPLLARIAADAAIPPLAKEMFVTLGEEYAQLKARLREIEVKLAAWHRRNALSRRLADIPGIGPITASLLVMKVADPKSFRCGRDFAAWLGLTPKDHSTAGKMRHGAITRAGDEALRRSLVVGATSVIQKARRGQGNPSSWLVALLKRKPPKLVAVALANKTARIAWKLMISGERYDPVAGSRARRCAALAGGFAPRLARDPHITPPGAASPRKAAEA